MMSHLQFCRANLSCNFIGCQNLKCDMACRATLEQSRNSFSEQSAVLYSVQLCHENAVYAEWSCLCDKVAVCDTQLCRTIKLRNKIAQ